MTPGVRKFVLTAHVVVSLGWFGAAAGVLALGIAGLTSADAETVRAAYLGTGLIWRFVVLPLSLAALLSGLLQALGTQWGLFRHYWVLTKFVLTFVAIILLLVHTGSLLPALTAGATDAESARTHLVVAAGGTLLVLLVAATLSVFKPWGKTRYGRRKVDKP